jgi:hypothetical protein
MLASIVPRGEEFFPQVIKHENGEHTVLGFYPPPPVSDDSSRPDNPHEAAQTT